MKTVLRWTWRLLLILAIPAAAYWLLLFGLRETVYVEEVKRGVAVLAVPGTVQVNAEVVMDIRSENAGRIRESQLRRGGYVAGGDVLVAMDTRALEIDTERLEAELRSLRARIEVGLQSRFELLDIEAQLENFEALARQGNYPQAELERQRRRAQQLRERVALEEINNQQQVQALETSLQARRLQMEQMTLHAPFDGVISQVHAFPGSLVNSGGAVATLVSRDAYVEVQLSEENFSGIELGMPATVRFLGYGNRLFSARVSHLIPVADPDTQRYRLHVSVDIEPDLLVPGLTGEVSIVQEERPGALIIPRQALWGEHVFVLHQGRIEQRRVQTGFLSLNEVEILQGLQEGETVVVEPLERLRTGDRVRAALPWRS